MNSRIVNLLHELEDFMAEAIPHVDKVQDAESNMHAAHEFLSRLKVLLSNDALIEDEEIHFFKHISPVFHSYLIYYVRLYKLESVLPAAGRSKEKLIKRELKTIDAYFVSESTAYRYFKSGGTTLDDELFRLQTQISTICVEESTCFADTSLSTPMGLKFARFIAYERLAIYLTERNAPRLRDTVAQGLLPEGVTFHWTDKKVHLQELTYALVYSHSINNGNIDVKSLAKLFESIFNIDLSNIYRAKQDMYTRKNTSAYLDFLKKTFKDGVDEADDRNNYR